MTDLSPLGQTYVTQFSERLAALPGAGNFDLQKLRSAGLARFAEMDFPTKRVEEWRFTNLAGLSQAKESFTPARDGEDQTIVTGDFHMAFHNGKPASPSAAALPAGIRLTSLAARLEDADDWIIQALKDDADQPIVALNTAYVSGGYVLEVDEDVTLAEPLRIHFSSDGGAWHCRNIIRMGKNSSLTLVESYHGFDATYFANPVGNIDLAEGATLNHYRSQAESINAWHLSHIDVTLAASATYDNFTLTTGAKLSRNQIHSLITGENAQSRLNGAYMLKGDQHCDTTTLTDHAVSNNESAQIYKGVLDGKAHGVFQGKILIRPDSQQINGDQLSKALLLSDDAAISCKPELEIHADDVKCSHGATSGEIDDTALFYLQSRGIPEDEARDLLIEAFLADVIEEIPHQQVRDQFLAIVRDWLNSRNASEGSEG